MLYKILLRKTVICVAVSCLTGAKRFPKFRLFEAKHEFYKPETSNSKTVICALQRFINSKKLNSNLNSENFWRLSCHTSVKALRFFFPRWNVTKKLKRNAVQNWNCSSWAFFQTLIVFEFEKYFSLFRELQVKLTKETETPILSVYTLRCKTFFRKIFFLSFVFRQREKRRVR